MASEVLDVLQTAQVPVGRVYTARDIAEDPHFRARGMVERITTADGLALDVPGIVPKLSATPGRIDRLAPTLGQDTDEVLQRLARNTELGESPGPLGPVDPSD
jgi:formyl-CoA transferase